MNSDEDEISSGRPGFETSADCTEAATSSPGLTEPSSRRGGSLRRMRSAVTSADSRSGTEGPVRVLRARGAAAGRTSESKNATCKTKPSTLHGRRGERVGSRSKNTPVMQPVIKKSAAKKASKQTPGPKLAKSTKGKGGTPTRASRSKQAAADKLEAEMEVSSCEEETLNGSNDNIAEPNAAHDEDSPCRDDPNDVIHKPKTKMERSRRRTALQQNEVKEEESEKEEEDLDIKKEESSKAVQSKERVGDNTEPSRKRARRQKDDKAPRVPKRRKKPPLQYVRCEIEGCGTVLAHPRYLQHHIKYQHLLKKKYVCDHPSCGRLFGLHKQLLRHAKHHTDQRDYICEYCARAFKSAHNLSVHRMIHTGEKPIQCEICGFTCRQKASLNWHMKKHDAEASYQFSCSICDKKFEKKDSVVAHKAKSHPKALIAEALAACGESAISTPTLTPETVPLGTQPDQPSVSQESRESTSGALTPLQPVVLPLTPQIDVSQGQFLPQAPTLLHLAMAPPAHLSIASHPQLIQLSTIPTSTVISMPTADPQGALFALGTITALTASVPLAPQQAVDAHVPGEGELWERVVVGGGHQDVGDMMWEGEGEIKTEDEGIDWEREGERQILQCAEVQGDSFM